jgi:hypothetical protein
VNQGVGGEVQERTQSLYPGNPVDHDVMGPQIQAHASVWQARQQPHVPQRAGHVQPVLPKPLARRQQLALVRPRGERIHADMVGQREAIGVDPHRPAQAKRRPVQPLPEPRHTMQSRLNRSAYLVDSDMTVLVE